MKFKRILAGALAGLMVITSVPVSGLGAIVASADETTTYTYEAVDKAVLKANATANTEQYPHGWTYDCEADNAFDGSSDYRWSTRYQNWDQVGTMDENDVMTQDQKTTMFEEGGFTPWIGSAFGETILLGKIEYQGRTDGQKGQNCIGGWKLWVANVEGTPEDSDWKVAASTVEVEGAEKFDEFVGGEMQTITLATPVEATHFKLEVLSLAEPPANTNPDSQCVAASEISVYKAIPEEPETEAPEVTAKREEVRANIAAAKQIVADGEGVYTEESLAALSEAITTAESDVETAKTVEDLDAITDILVEKQDALVLVNEAVAVPVLSMTAPAAGGNVEDAAVTKEASEGSAAALVDKAESATLTAREGTTIEIDEEANTFSGQFSVDNAALNVTGTTPILFSLKFNAGTAPTADLALVGKMDTQYGVQISATKIVLYTQSANTSALWPEIAWDVPSDFDWAADHEVVAVYDGANLRIAVDGTWGTTARKNGAVSLPQCDYPFTVAYNPEKPSNTVPYNAYTGDFEYITVYVGDQVPEVTSGTVVADLVAALADKTATLDLAVKPAVEAAGNDYTIESVSWTDEEGNTVDADATFAAYTDYTVEIVLKAADGYAFAASSIPGTIKIGEEDVAVEPVLSDDRTTLTLTYTFDGGKSPEEVKDEAKAALNAAMDAARETVDAGNDNNKWTVASWNALEDAWNAAIDIDKETATADEMTAAADALNAAFEGLVVYVEATMISGWAPIVYSAPVAGRTATNPVMVPGENGTHYDELADRAANPATLTLDPNSRKPVEVQYADGNWAYAGEVKAANNDANNGKFDVYGADNPMVIRFKMKTGATDVSGTEGDVPKTVQVLGKMDEQYGVQFNSDIMIVYAHDANNGWVQSEVDLGDDFANNWHDVMVVFTGTDMQIYLDGTKGAPSEGRVNAAEGYVTTMAQRTNSTFTTGYNIAKVGSGESVAVPYSGLLADVQLYSGEGLADVDLSASYTAIYNALDAATPAVNMTFKPYNAATKWYAGDEELAADDRFVEGTVYTSVTTLTAHEGYAFQNLDASGLVNDDITSAACEVSADGKTLTLTLTYAAAPAPTCSCVLGDITFADATISMGVAASKTYNLNATAALSGNCEVEGHGETTVAYEITEGADIASIEGSVLTVTGAGTVKVKATITAGEAEAKEKVATFTVTSNRATAAEKEELNTVIGSVESLKEAEYTAESWAALQSALTAAEAVRNKDNASKTEVENAKNAVTAAKAALKTKVDAALEAFKAANDRLKALDAKLYTVESYNAAIEIQNLGVVEYNKGSNADADKLAEYAAQLTAALENMVTNLEAAKADLAKALEAAKAIYEAGQKDYTDDSWKAFADAYDAATKADLATATTDDLTKLVTALTTAQTALASKVTLAAPTIKKVKANAAKKGVVVKVTVNKVANADKYEVYRVVGGTATLVGTTKSGKVALKDSAVTKKKVEYYAVAVSADGKKSANGAAVKVTLGKATKIKKVSKASNGIKITWKKVRNAKKYVIYRSTKKNSGYVRIAKVKKNLTTYVDKKAKSGKKYFYKVVAVGKKQASLMSKASKKVKR